MKAESLFASDTAFCILLRACESLASCRLAGVGVKIGTEQ